MKKTAISMILATAALVVFMTGSATAQGRFGTGAGSPEQGKLHAEIMMLNYDAQMPQADAVISKQLAQNFSVSPDKIASLKSQNLQYGEVAAVLAFAQKMPGGVTDANINKVINLRQSGPGWSQVAKNLNVDPAIIADKLSSIENDAHSGIKQALVESSSVGQGAGGSGGINEPGAATGGTGTYGSGAGGTGGMNQPGEESGETGTNGSGAGGTYSEPGAAPGGTNGSGSGTGGY